MISGSSEPAAQATTICGSNALTPLWSSICPGGAVQVVRSCAGLRMPGELPEGCHYSRWSRLRDEWRLALRIWRKNRSQPELERTIISQHGQHVAVHELRSKREVNDFLNGGGRTG